jgi:hypothetical protein
MVPELIPQSLLGFGVLVGCGVAVGLGGVGDGGTGVGVGLGGGGWTGFVGITGGGPL